MKTKAFEKRLEISELERAFYNNWRDNATVVKR
jgi:hypothetical protein